MSKLGQRIAQYWENIQGSLFPFLEEELDPLSQKQRQLIAVLELIRIEEHIPDYFWTGRPPSARTAIARAFVAKAVYNFSTTEMLIDRLKSDKNFRRICGWERKTDIPHKSTFSRDFTWFSKLKLPQLVHDALIKTACAEDIIGHTSYDSTAIEAREKVKKYSDQYLQEQTEELELLAQKKGKRGRPKKGEIRIPKQEEPNRIDKQLSMSLPEMLGDLPKACDIGCKKNSQGYVEKWKGYKLHLASADGGIPLSAILTSASVHDSQVAIPLMSLTAERAINCYDLMDAAYDDERIKEYSRSLNHVPLIDENPRRDVNRKNEIETEAKARKILNFKMPEDIRYNERTTVERSNARLKDEFGARTVRVKGDAKVMCHLMFGVLALTADQLLRLIN